MARKGPPNPNGRTGDPLRIPLPFEDALKAATEVKPPERKPKKKRVTKP